MSFLTGRRGSLGHSQVSEKVLCDMRKTFARFAEDDLHFSWQARHFRRVVLRVLRIALSGLHQGWCQRATCVAGLGHCESVILRGKRSIW